MILLIVAVIIVISIAYVLGSMYKDEIVDSIRAHLPQTPASSMPILTNSVASPVNVVSPVMMAAPAVVATPAVSVPSIASPSMLSAATCDAIPGTTVIGTLPANTQLYCVAKWWKDAGCTTPRVINDYQKGRTKDQILADDKIFFNSKNVDQAKICRA